MWSPPTYCECGHKMHTGRCQPLPDGCPCHKHTDTKAREAPNADDDYYMDAIGRRMGG